jgi:hypothetical protein
VATYWLCNNATRRVVGFFDLNAANSFSALLLALIGKRLIDKTGLSEPGHDACVATLRWRSAEHD